MSSSRDMSFLRQCAKAASMLLCLVSLPAGAAPRALVDRSLVRTPVDLLGWNETSVSYIDEFGQIRRAPIGEYIAVLPGAGSTRTGTHSRGWARPADEDLAGGTPVVIELVDGQRLLGSVGPWDSSSVSVPTAEEDAIAVLTPGFGPRMLPLGRVSRVLIDPWTETAADRGRWTPGVDDELILVNGDRLHGFLVEFGDDILFDAGGGERSFEFRRIAEIRLGNPAEKWTGPRVWWSTGDVRRARASGEPDQGIVRLTDNPVADPLAELVDNTGDNAVEFSIGAIDAAWLDEGAMIPLGVLEITRQEPLAERRWTSGVRKGSQHEAPLGTPHIVLPGPMRVEWLLPPEAAQFGTIARLGGALDRPRALPGRWSHARMHISIVSRTDTTELAAVTLDRTTPSAPIMVELPATGEPGRLLVIELRPALFGPIQDRVLLDRPMLTAF